jgi:hypothetical protein
MAAMMLATLSGVPGADAGVAAPGGKWGKAIEIPGSMKLNAGNTAFVDSVSCGAAGDCAVGGSYTDIKGHDQVFLVSQRNGRWGQAQKVKGTLSAGPFAVVNVSCAGRGDCTAGGYYATSVDTLQAFVVTERNGRWGAATKVPGLAALNKGGSAGVDLVSCSSSGNCGVIGGYLTAAHKQGWFAVNQRGGRWGAATQLRGLGSTSADIESMSCGAVGDCAAVGRGHDNNAIVMSEHGGHWGSAITVPGISTLNTGGLADLKSVSCPASGTCTGVGGYVTSKGFDESFVVNQTHGRWRRAFALPQAALPNPQRATLYLVSCAAAGDCSAAGLNTNHSGQQEVFVAGDRNGRWGKPTELPGLAALNTGGIGDATSISCAAPGDCAIGGSYLDVSKDTVAYVASEQSGVWTKAIEVPSASLLNNGSFSTIESVSCKVPGRCSAGGWYLDGEGNQQVFVVSQS